VPMPPESKSMHKTVHMVVIDAWILHISFPYVHETVSFLFNLILKQIPCLLHNK